MCKSLLKVQSVIKKTQQMYLWIRNALILHFTLNIMPIIRFRWEYLFMRQVLVKSTSLCHNRAQQSIASYFSLLCFLFIKAFAICEAILHCITLQSIHFWSKFKKCWISFEYCDPWLFNSISFTLTYKLLGCKYN